ncbi:MAG TPA: hypothetical protein VLQ67_07465, partial [Arachnia sp.]|nr:hypothetical protein [Arachnia sp.]
AVDKFEGRAIYNPEAKALSDGLYAPVAAGAKISLPVTKDLTAFATQKPLGFMVVSYDNPAGKEASLIRVQ